MPLLERRRYRGKTHNISPDTIEGLAVLFFLLLAGLSIFSLIDLAGKFGVFWKGMLVALFGGVAWLLPAYIVALGIMRLIRPPRQGVLVTGLSLLVLVISALADSLGAAEKINLLNDGGGYIGLLLRWPLESVFDYWMTVVILTVLLIATIIIIFDITLMTFIRATVLQPARVMKQVVIGQKLSPVKSAPLETSDTLELTAATSKWRLPFFTRRKEDVSEIEPAEIIDEVLVNEEIGDSAADDDFEEVDGGAPVTARVSSQPKHQTIKYKPIEIDLPLNLLEPSKDKPTSGDVEANKELIRRTFESFNIKVEMGEVSVGPTVTQYTLKPDAGVKLAAITGLSNDLALALAAHPIRIEAPIPGKSLVGIEVPNTAVAMVKLRDILESDLFQKRSSNLILAIGKDVSGKSWVADLERMPHLLVAGATGAGKSVALNGIILSLLYQNNPSDLKIILIDPKRVEFSVYKHMPHLLTPIITEVPATVNALKWLLSEMDRRFIVMSESGDRNIQTYNQRHAEKMPYIVLVIDELADIMVSAASEVESAIIRLAQMARAVGIHLVLATQRPSVDVITGLIKANVPARIAFSVASLTDSRTILDASGAEKLLGRGDLLFVSAEVAKPKRVQGAYVTDDEIRNVVNYLKQKATPEYIEGVTAKPSGGGYGGSDEDDDPLYNEAETIIIDSKKASASYLQRRLKVGYARAARLLDILEARGVIGPGEGAKPREVLMTREERDMMSANNDDEDEEVMTATNSDTAPTWTAENSPEIVEYPAYVDDTDEEESDENVIMGEEDIPPNDDDEEWQNK